MGRKASNKIKVTIQVAEMDYQQLAIAAGKDAMTVTDYVDTMIRTRAQMSREDALAKPPEPPPTFRLTTDAPAPTSDLQSNADSRTEDEPRRKQKR